MVGVPPLSLPAHEVLDVRPPTAKARTHEPDQRGRLERTGLEQWARPRASGGGGLGGYQPRTHRNCIRLITRTVPVDAVGSTTHTLMVGAATDSFRRNSFSEVRGEQPRRVGCAQGTVLRAPNV